MTAEYTKKTYTLNTGAKIPAVGLGTWQSKPNEVRGAVKAALLKGYHHIDTAAAYANEGEVGDGIKDSGVPRESFWLTTKLDNMHHKRAEAALEDSLKNLKTDYLDLWLMHWPCSVTDDTQKVAYDDWNYIDTWKEMVRIQKAHPEKVKNIGVSNFQITHLKKLLAEDVPVPAVNQIELHPNYPSPKLVEFCKSKGIHCTGYSCLGSTGSPLYKNATVQAIADSKGKTVQQILLVWGLQHEWSVIPKSVSASRIEANFEIDGITLDAEEMKKLDNLDGTPYKVCGEWLPDKIFVDGPN